MKKNITVEYRNLAEFLRAAEKCQQNRWSECTERNLWEAFIGVPNYAELLKRREGFAEGVASLKALPEFEELVSQGHVKRVWSDIDGDTWDQERFLDERKFLLRRVKTGGIKKGKMITLAVNVTESCKVSHAAMLWKSYAAVKVADDLEARGNRVKIVFVIAAQKVSDTVDQLYISTVLKDFHEPINLSLLASWLSPWFFRFWGFAVMKSLVPDIRSSYGCPDTLRDFGDNTIKIDEGACLNEFGAKNWIRKQQAA